MQGTVASFDASSWEGSVLLDDGVQVAFDGTALVGSGLRLLRPGQRVRLELDDRTPPRVARLQIITLT